MGSATTASIAYFFACWSNAFSFLVDDAQGHAGVRVLGSELKTDVQI